MVASCSHERGRSHVWHPVADANGGLVFLGGAVPVKQGGTFVGAVGVSGGTVENDVAIASAAAASLS